MDSSVHPTLFILPLRMKVSHQSIPIRLITGVVALTLGLPAIDPGIAQAVIFQSTGTSTPKRSTGGASRGMNFIPNGSGAPKNSTGGASRGVNFIPSGSGAPKTSTGGASRTGTLFKPTPGRAVRQSTGGASRGTLFQPNRTKILRAAGGASRGHSFSSGSAPKQTAGGASRDANSYVGESQSNAFPASLMALVPQEFTGNTLSERPTFLVYLPESNAEEAIFSLKDEVGNLIYQTILPISGEAGVAKVTIPNTIPALEIGKNYQWLTALVVDGRLTPSTPYVDGWIQRVATTPEMAKALSQTDRLARAQSLASLGIWYDTAATLIEMREAQPESEVALKNWQELLTSVGLKDIQAVPLLQYQ